MSEPDPPAGPSTAQDKTQSKILKHEWFLRTFRSRQRTEELLRPELEAGNLTYNDYASAVQFLPHIGPRLFPFFFSVALASSIAAYGLFKKPPWPRQKLLLYGFGSAFMTHDLGEVGVWTMRQRWMQQLENQRGFEIAMGNIASRVKKEQVGGLLKRSDPPTLASNNTPSIPPASSNDHIVESTPQWTWQSEGQDTHTIPAQRMQDSEDNAQSQRSQSRWEEIRRVQFQSTPQRSTWDRIREGQARDSAASNERSGRNGRGPDADRERAIAQAEFDQLLENERKMGSD